MGTLIGIVAIVIYYAVISNLIDTGSASAGFVAVTYLLIPLIGIPLVVSTTGSAIASDAKNRHLKISASATLFIVISISGIHLADKILAPSTPNPIADEQSRKAAWVERGQEAVKFKLKDPDSAQFRNIYFHKAKDGVPMTCGEVNSKNSFGGYGGFQKFISAGKPELTYLSEQMGEKEFALLWNRLCAN